MTISSKFSGDGAMPAASPRSSRSLETPEWCRGRAAADLVAAGATDTANGRLRFEHSAITWTARADLLQRLQDGSDARRIALAAPPQRHIGERKELEHVRL